MGGNKVLSKQLVATLDRNYGQLLVATIQASPGKESDGETS